MYYSGLEKRNLTTEDPHIFRAYPLNGEFCYDGFLFCKKWNDEKYHADNEFFKQVYLKNMHLITPLKNEHSYDEFEVLINPRVKK